MLFESVFGYRNDNDLICHSPTGSVAFSEFKYQLALATRFLRGRLTCDQCCQVALYSEDSYEFSVLLFAALACNAQVIIPANNKRGTALQIGTVALWLGDWKTKENSNLENIRENESPIGGSLKADLPRVFNGGISLFTSGSSGEPQRVDKSLAQLMTEVAAHQRHWGMVAKGAITLATVSHQHIYGLLFKVLWPLSSGRPFASKTYMDIGGLLREMQQTTPVLWVVSPAQLSRCMDDWPWQSSRSLKAIFSSGGPLSAVDAQLIERLSGVAPQEIYGSTETGGIAWRQQSIFEPWQPLKGVEVSADSKGMIQVNSPWLEMSYSGQDRVSVKRDGSFRLLGRMDRIVKIAEKRISLSQVDTLLSRSEWIQEARTLTIKRRREYLAAVIVLSTTGAGELQRIGKAAVVRKLKAELAPDIDSVALPRFWRFVSAIPVDQQGKSTKEQLIHLFDTTPTVMLPQIESRELSESNAKLTLRIPANLACFPGHFEGTPVVPGVVQIDWAIHYGREMFGVLGCFSAMEVIKFKRLLMPRERVTLEMNYNPVKNKLKFCFRAVDREAYEYSSGRLCFKNG
ncbi:AMP-binding protein [Microbulbifer sp. 2201CG32-9]|uniref:AMP-binding protein n=1 Tax=Microbulbifer sp. 2201CG32-9 TaxID=3232309 RepID=UPI00345C12EF